MCSRRVWSYSINGCVSAIAYKSNMNMNTVVCGALKSIGLSARRVLAKFHYTDTDTDPTRKKSAHVVWYELNSTTRTRTRARHGHGHGLFCGETPLGPCGSVSPQKSPCPCPCRARVRVRVRVVEFSSYPTTCANFVRVGSVSGPCPCPCSGI